MNSLVVYTSTYGNTEKIAQAIAAGCGAQAVTPATIRPDKLRDASLLIVGSPTQGGRPTQDLQTFLANLPSASLTGKSVAAFDTRLDSREQGAFIKLVMRTVNYAAGRIAKLLVSKGGQLVGMPQGFYVLDKEGPLKDGEIERATMWAMGISHTPTA